jgi:hypothetical protein
MVIIKLKGGLGNQLFQYAAAKSIARNNQTEVLIDAETGFKGDPYKRSFALMNFCIESKVEDASTINSLINKNKVIKYLKNRLSDFFEIGNLKYLNEPFYHFDPQIAAFKISKDIYLEGYFHSERYFNDISNEIRSEFELKYPADTINSKYLAQINSSESVALHVRKYDDALANSANEIYGSCTTEYYQKAISYMQEKLQDPFFFVFSDDIRWTKKNINIDTAKVEYISHNDIEKGHEDIRLMKACKHNIIANSSFSWWGAWLNKNSDKIVIAPDRWLDTEIYDFKDVVPANWIKL